MIRAILGSMASGVAQRVIAAVITLMLTPVYLRELGNYDYGIWEVIISVVGYLGIVDLGLRPTISRFVATCSGDAPDRVEQARSIFNTSLVLMCGAGVVASGLLVLWSLLYPEAIAQEGAPEGRYALVLQLTALRLLITFPGAAFESALEGMLRYVEKDAVSTLLSVAGAVYMYFRLDDHDPLVLLCVVTLIQAASKAVILALLLSRDPMRRFAFALRGWSSARAVEMVRFGSKNLVQGLATLVTRRSKPVVIAWALGPEFVVFFTLAQALFRQAGSVIAVTTHALMPGFARLNADGRQHAIRDYFFVGSRSLFAFHGLIASGIMVYCGDFIRLWVGSEYAEKVSEVAVVMAFGSMVLGALPLHNRLLVALGRHGPLSLMYVVRAVLGLGLSLALVWPFGVIGISIASLIANSLVLPWIWSLVFSALSGGSARYLRTTTLPVLAVAGVTALAGFGARSMHPVETWLGLILHASGVAALYAILCLLFVFGSEERLLLLRVWRQVAPAPAGMRS